MFTLSAWTQVQNVLLADPAYAGMMPGRSADRILIVWRRNAQPSAGSYAVIELLGRLGVGTDQEVSSASHDDTVREQARLIAERSSWLEVYVVGPNATNDRLDVVVALGSFAKAETYGADVLTELAPHVPVAIVEGDRPIPAALVAP